MLLKLRSAQRKLVEEQRLGKTHPVPTDTVPEFQSKITAMVHNHEKYIFLEIHSTCATYIYVYVVPSDQLIPFTRV